MTGNVYFSSGQQCKSKCCNVYSNRLQQNKCTLRQTYNLLTNMAIYTEKQRKRNIFSDDASA